MNDYRPFELPLAIPLGRLLLRSDLLEGQRDGFCHVIYGRSCGIANCGSRRLDHGNSSTVMRICRISSRSFRRSAGACGTLEPHLASCRYARLRVLQRCDRHGCDIVQGTAVDAEALGRALEQAFT